MPTYTEIDTLYLVERTQDEDGKGWSFAKLALPADLIGTYVNARALWEERTAHGYNTLMDTWDIPAEHRVLFVNEGAFDRAVASMSDVMEAVMALQMAGREIEKHVAQHEVNTFGIKLDESDWMGEVEFNAHYMPLIRAADVMNERANNDKFSHANRLVSHGYTSLFNGR